MMDVVAAFPPAQAQPSNKIGNNDSNAGISLKVMRDSHVACIMGSKYELVPEAAKEQAGESKPGSA
jgi:hypothetical protein